MLPAACAGRFTDTSGFAQAPELRALPIFSCLPRAAFGRESPSSSLGGNLLYRRNFVDPVAQLRLVGLAPGEGGEVGQQLEHLAAGRRRRPRRLQAVPAPGLRRGRGGDGDAVRGPGPAPGQRQRLQQRLRRGTGLAGRGGGRGARLAALGRGARGAGGVRLRAGAVPALGDGRRRIVPRLPSCQRSSLSAGRQRAGPARGRAAGARFTRQSSPLSLSRAPGCKHSTEPDLSFWETSIWGLKMPFLYKR